jgi:hypothetical protein
MERSGLFQQKMALSTTDFHPLVFIFAVIGSPVTAFLLVTLLQ